MGGVERYVRMGWGEDWVVWGEWRDMLGWDAWGQDWVVWEEWRGLGCVGGVERYFRL